MNSQIIGAEYNKNRNININKQIVLTVIIQLNQICQRGGQAMKIKDKFIKQKQLTDRPQVTLKNTDSTPLLTRLEKQYLFHQPHPQKTSRDNFLRGGDKQNFANMVNSVPANNEYLSHNVIKIDNYEGKRFKTQQGYEPMMTKSRYMVEKEQADHALQNAMYKSSQNIVLRRNKQKKMDDKIYESIDFVENERPLTFGLVRKTSPMQSSIQYKEDVRIKNEVLDEISSLRKSQQTLNGSKDYSGVGQEDIPKCVNHQNKKAKYKLSAENEKEEQDMIYCSKCAINLLQQGFKVDQIKQNMAVTRKIISSQHHALGNHMISSAGAPSRIQEMRSFEQKLSEVEAKINQSLEDSSVKTSGIQQIERQLWQTQSIYDQMIEQLQKMKQIEMGELNEKKKKKILNIQRYQKQMTQELESIHEMKKQMKEYRNKFVIMKEHEFQFLISSFLNKIQLYGNNFKEGEIAGRPVEDQIDQIIIDMCEFCKTIKNVDESRYSDFSKAHENNCPRHASEDDFICKEIKGPFRTLFPEDEVNSNEKKNICEDSPSFNKKEVKTTNKGGRKNEMIKNQYY